MPSVVFQIVSVVVMECRGCIMDITERVIGSTIVLDIRGRLYGLDAQGLERAVDRLGRAGWRRFVANLEDVSAIDAGGLGSLLAARRASVRHHGTLRLTRARPRIHELIVVTHLPRVLETFNSLDEALDDAHRVTTMTPAARTLQKWLRNATAGSMMFVSRP
jgi:anti-anti-sigma factor